MITEDKLVFLISQPRSGSTLLQKIVSNNSYVDTVSEPWSLLPILSPLKPSLITATYDYQMAIKAMNDFLDKKAISARFKTKLKSLILDLYSTESTKYFIDKTPRYYEILPEIYELFPDARYLVLKRNPFACLYSMVTTWTNTDLDINVLSTFHRDFLNAPFLIQSFITQTKGLKNIFVIKYEDYVSEPEKRIKEIYAWLNIPYSDDTLNIQGNQKTKGLFGDDSGRGKLQASIASNRSTDWMNAVNTNRKLSNFMSQYQEYLTREFVAEYGYSSCEFEKPKWGFTKPTFVQLLDVLSAQGKYDNSRANDTRKRSLGYILRHRPFDLTFKLKVIVHSLLRIVWGHR